MNKQEKLFAAVLIASMSTSLATQAAAENCNEIAFSGHSVAEAQQQLQCLGYAISQIDGCMGTETREALFEFQSSNKLPMEGALDNKTSSRLHEQANAECGTKPEAVPAAVEIAENTNQAAAAPPTPELVVIETVTPPPVKQNSTRVTVANNTQADRSSIAASKPNASSSAGRAASTPVTPASKPPISPNNQASKPGKWLVGPTIELGLAAGAFGHHRFSDGRNGGLNYGQGTIPKLGFVFGNTALPIEFQATIGSKAAVVNNESSFSLSEVISNFFRAMFGLPPEDDDENRVSYKFATTSYDALIFWAPKSSTNNSYRLGGGISHHVNPRVRPYDDDRDKPLAQSAMFEDATGIKLRADAIIDDIFIVGLEAEFIDYEPSDGRTAGKQDADSIALTVGFRFGMDKD